MEVWLQRLTVVLFTVDLAALVISGQQTVIVGGPEQVSVDFGSSVTLGCVFNPEKEKYERVRVAWYFHPNRSSPNEKKIHSDVFNKSTEATHVLSNVTDTASGLYFCTLTVEIPSHAVSKSNGTQILVSQSSEYTTNPSLVTSEQVPVKRQLPFAWWIWVVLAVSAFIFIILLITYASLRSRCINSTADDPVYANTRPVANKQPSPRPGAQVDTLKKVSSSQNLKTPNSGRRYEEGKRRQKL